MKATLMISLALISLSAFGNPTKIISEICHYDYIEGITLRSINGHDMRVCHYSESLSDIYLTDIEIACASTHEVEREYQFTKLCVLKGHLK